MATHPPHPGSDDLYAAPDYYDRRHRRQWEDIEHYLELAATIGGPVLELGCGTGRITLALAQAGHRVTGIDCSEPMLQSASRKLAAEAEGVRNRVELRRMDMRKVRLGRRFRLVLAPFNALQHLYSRHDLEQCLAAVGRHLMPRAGRFAFDVLVPDEELLARNPNRRYKHGTVRYPGLPQRYDYLESSMYDPISQIQIVLLHFDDPKDPTQSFVTHLCQRQLYPAELEALLVYNGLRIDSRLGGFDGSPLDGQSESQIYLCRLR